MNVLSNSELSEIKGGVSAVLWYILGGVATFVAGAIAGFINPSSCKS